MRIVRLALKCLLENKRLESPDIYQIPTEEFRASGKKISL
jgi:hypothetical protein